MEEKKDIEFEGEETLNINQTSNTADGVYPNAKLNISRDMFSVYQMKRKWEKEPSMLDLTPDFQRDYVWEPKQKCELIESMIMGIPLPAFYVRENQDGVYVVVDGKQRLGTLFDFIDNKFELNNLSILKQYNGLSFSQLKPIEQNKIEDYSLNVNVIKAPTSDRVTFDLFDRVNRGGTRLNNQEMRNALFQGTSTRLINELAKNAHFKAVTEKSIKPKHMKDRYLVLRFVAFYLWKNGISIDTDDRMQNKLQYKSNIDDFLGKTMRFINTLSDNDSIIIELKNDFEIVMSLAQRYVLPLGGFRLKSDSSKQKRPINMAFLESFCYLISAIRKNIDMIEEKIIYAYKTLINDSEYTKTLTYSIDSTTQTNTRYEIINKFI